MILLVILYNGDLCMLGLLCHSGNTMVTKPSVLNSLIGVISSGGHCKGSLPAIVDLIACSSI